MSIPHDAATLLLSHVRDELAATNTGLPTSVREGLTVGQLVAWDACCDGQLTVSIEALFPSTRFPEPDRTSQRCGAGGMAVRLTVMMLRCAPMPNRKTGKPPTTETLSDAAATVMDDAQALMTASCSFRGAAKPWNVFVDQTLMVGPAGGCQGVRLPVTVGWVV